MKLLNLGCLLFLHDFLRFFCPSSFGLICFSVDDSSHSPSFLCLQRLDAKTSVNNLIAHCLSHDSDGVLSVTSDNMKQDSERQGLKFQSDDVLRSNCQIILWPGVEN